MILGDYGRMRLLLRNTVVALAICPPPAAGAPFELPLRDQPGRGLWADQPSIHDASSGHSSSGRPTPLNQNPRPTAQEPSQLPRSGPPAARCTAWTVVLELPHLDTSASAVTSVLSGWLENAASPGPKGVQIDRNTQAAEELSGDELGAVGRLPPQSIPSGPSPIASPIPQYRPPARMESISIGRPQGCCGRRQMKCCSGP
jgi:hypothetical protein